VSPIPDFGRNRTLFGLRTNANLIVRYAPYQNRIETVSGMDVDASDVEPAEALVFNIPAYIAVAGIPLFPSTYEIATHGFVSYHSRHPPRDGIRLTQRHDLNECTKERRYSVDSKKLAAFDHRRRRYPAACAVMGESATAHAKRLIDAGALALSPGTAVAWHWCHLIAFSFLPTGRAQAKRNLICGTSAFNGQMASIEAALKMFVYQFDRPLSLEVTATCLANTHFGLRLRYRISDRYSGESHTEYFDPYGAAQGDYSDCSVVYERLVASFDTGRPGRLIPNVALRLQALGEETGGFGRKISGEMSSVKAASIPSSRTD
jgi:hypothetical protein